MPKGSDSVQGFGFGSREPNPNPPNPNPNPNPMHCLGSFRVNFEPFGQCLSLFGPKIEVNNFFLARNRKKKSKFSRVRVREKGRKTKLCEKKKSKKSIYF